MTPSALPIGFYSIAACQFPQYTTEWSIPYSNTRECLRELRHMFQLEHADRLGTRVHFPVEIRFSAPDDIWLSPSYGQKTTWIGIIQYKSVFFSPPPSVGVHRSLFRCTLIRSCPHPHSGLMDLIRRIVNSSLPLRR